MNNPDAYSEQPGTEDRARSCYARGASALLLTMALGLASLPAHADSGFYLGGSVGSATVEGDFDDIGDEDFDFDFDESDFAWKAFGGYNFDLLFIDLAIEAGYVDFGNMSGNSLEVDVSGLDVFGLVGIELGPLGLFAKAGVINWDTEVSSFDFDVDEDGTDPAYGVGARFSIGSLEIRGEFEYFDVDTVDDTYLLSAGLVWTF